MQKTRNRLFAGLLVGAMLTVLIGATSCAFILEPDTTVRFFTVQVDSLQVTAEPAEGDTLVIRFYGVVGPNLCHSFSHFEVERDPHRLDITVWGKHRDTGAPCAAAIRFLDGEAYSVHPLFDGDFLIVVHQPDESTLERVVEILPGSYLRTGDA